MGDQAAFGFPRVEPLTCGAPGPRGMTCGREPHADTEHTATGKPPQACPSCDAPAGKDCPVPEACIMRWQHARRAT